MAGSLNGRVRRLENGRVGPCEECGFDGDWSNVEVVVDFYDGPEETTYCETCGEPTDLVLVWDDLVDHERRERRS
jgi:hypothetical protein